MYLKGGGERMISALNITMSFKIFNLKKESWYYYRDYFKKSAELESKLFSTYFVCIGILYSSSSRMDPC